VNSTIFMIDVQLMLDPSAKTKAPPLPDECAMVLLHPLIPVLRVWVLRPRINVFVAHTRMAGTNAAHVLEPMPVPILLTLIVARLEVGVVVAVDVVGEAMPFEEVGRAMACVEARLHNAGVDEGDAGVEGGECIGAVVKIRSASCCRGRGGWGIAEGLKRCERIGARVSLGLVLVEHFVDSKS